ncbi:DoxX family protein [Millionella massiliensis]|uniref:DoxX family protein n=1 Tax=Millionella massiliensis TaxID=1871023 RepID=UPI0008D9102E|nr:DoxX family protein [Millionella massiliensis]
MKVSQSNRWVSFLLSDRYANLALLLLRLFVGGMMLTHGVAKIQNFEALRAAFPDPIGWGAGISLVMIILVEVGCSLLVLAGLMTRFATLPLIFSMIMAISVHPDMSLASIELPMLYAGLFLVILVAGPGKCSVDYLIGKMFERPE